jgi:soluble lytic murein transglycosylase-like protein
LINGKILADLLRMQYLQLGLPGDLTIASDSSQDTGFEGPSFSDLLTSFLMDTTAESEWEQSAKTGNIRSDSPWDIFAKTMGSQLTPFLATASPAASSVQPQQLDAIIQTVSEKYGVSPDLIRAVVQQESGFNPKAVSKAGALGLMQLMPGTARAMGVLDPFDPYQNIDGGVRYLKQLLDRYHGRVDLALAAYNAGPGAVDQYGGIPPYAETRSYVQSILQHLNYV